VYLIGSASEVLEARAEPTREEDPFSVQAKEAFDRVCADVLRERPGARLALSIANCYGGWTFCDPQVERLVRQGPSRVSAYLSVAWFPAAAQGRITIGNQLKVPALTFSTEFYAFHDAMRVCRFWLSRGLCDVALAGAAETVGSPFLSAALGPGARNDAVVWLAFANDGEERVYLDEAHPAPPAGITETITSDFPLGTPLRGSCALPLLILEARARRPCTLDVARRMLVRADLRSLSLWRHPAGGEPCHAH
jgi:hypothetical protein